MYPLVLWFLTSGILILIIDVFMYIDGNVGKIEQTNKDSDSEMKVHVRQ